jgi:transcription-repair coupling factor (superfamily II helicase)
MVDFADGRGDVLLSTNIIESGLDVPRANTIFVWRADRFGLAQLHQLRGRVGRGRIQGIAYLLTSEEDDISDETRLRLAAMVDNDRLGAGLALSVQDLDLRGGGDITGEDQAGHMKVIGVSLYQKLLERAVMGAEERPRLQPADVAINLGVTGTIPHDFVPDASVRLSLYAKLLRATSISTVDALSEELVDRFGDIPDAVTTLLRLQKLRIKAARFGITKIDAGPRAMALTFATKPTRGVVRHLSLRRHAKFGEGRLIYEQLPGTPSDPVAFFERVFHDAALAQKRNSGNKT